MGTPTAIYQTVNQIGIREDLSGVIYSITPVDTYFTSKVAKTKATSTTHEWQTDTLDSPSAANAYVEGDDFSAQTITPTVRLKNYTQISRKDFVISRTSNLVNTAGRATELAYQKVRKGMALRRDIESACLQNKAATIAASNSARVAASVETWIYTNNDIQASGVTTGTTPAPVSGVAGTAGTDGTASALVSGDVNLALQQAWSTGGMTDVILVGPTLKAKIDAFTAIAAPRRVVNQDEAVGLVMSADVYVSDFGSHKVMLSRYMRASVVLCLDMSTWALAWLDQIHVEEIAKSGDSEKRMIVGEWTLEARSPTANTKLVNRT